MYLYGPVNILVGTVPYCKSWGGVTLNFKEKERVIPLLNGDVKRAHAIQYGAGIIHSAEIKPIYLTKATTGQNNLILVDYSELVFENTGYRLILFYAQILFPVNMQIGLPKQSPFDLRLFFKRNPTTGDLFKLEIL